MLVLQHSNGSFQRKNSVFHLEIVSCDYGMDDFFGVVFEKE